MGLSAENSDVPSRHGEHAYELEQAEARAAARKPALVPAAPKPAPAPVAVPAVPKAAGG